MKKWKKFLLTVIPATLSLSFTSLADQWYQDMNGWWYGDDAGNNLITEEGWHWIDGDHDGWAECYYFNRHGHVINSTRMVDGYDVDEDGAWTVNGEIQRQAVTVYGAENDPEAMQVYHEAEEKSDAQDSYDVGVDYLLGMSMDGESEEMTMHLDMKMRGIRSNNPEYIAEGTMSMDGLELPFSMFYTDGWYYMDMYGIKVRQEMDMAEAIASANAGVVMVEDSMMSGLSLDKEGDNSVLTYSMDTNSLNAYLNSILGSVLFEELDIAYNIKDTHGRIVVNGDGYFTETIMCMDFDMTMREGGEEETVGMKVDMKMQFNNPGQPVEFTLPSTEGYEEF